MKFGGNQNQLVFSASMTSCKVTCENGTTLIQYQTCIWKWRFFYFKLAYENGTTLIKDQKCIWKLHHDYSDTKLATENVTTLM